MINFLVLEHFNQLSIRSFLLFFHFSRSNIYKLEHHKRLYVNNVFYTFDHLLNTNDIIEIDFNDFKDDQTVPYQGDIDIIFEDQDIVILNKPTHLLVHTDGHTIDTLTNRVKHHYQTLAYDIPVLPVHRIDTDTSGMVIFAKHPLSLSYLSYLFEHHEIKKTYVCLVKGQLKKHIGSISFSIAKDRHSNLQIVTQTGKEATSKYRVIQYENDISKVEVDIKSGRKHQIRVHMSAIGHPIVGDKLYQGPDSDRLMLHFKSVSFIHPRTLTYTTYQKEEPF